MVELTDQRAKMPPTLHTKMQMESPIQVDSPLSMEHPTAPPPDDSHPLRIFAFDTHRTCAMLFNQLLSAHLKLGALSHPYAFAATIGPERIHTRLYHSERTQQLLDQQMAAVPPRIASETYQSATQKFLRDADKLEQRDKILFVKENASFVMKPEVLTSALRSQETIVSKLWNPTVIPDELLELVTPIVFIRHPAVVIPAWWREANIGGSCYDIDDEDVTVWTSLRWTRMVFDYLRSSKHMQQPRSLGRRNTISSTNSRSRSAPVVASRPFVIDAADVVNNTHAVLSMLCRLLDIDSAVLNNAWSPTRRFSQAGEAIRAGIADNMMKAFSSRLQPGDDQEQIQHTSEYNIDLNLEHAKWVQEFGEQIASKLKQRVEQEMPHFNYLKKFKLNARPKPNLVRTNSESVSGFPERRRSATELDATVDQEGESTMKPGHRSRSSVDVRQTTGPKTYKDNTFRDPTHIVRSAVEPQASFCPLTQIAST